MRAEAGESLSAEEAFAYADLLEDHVGREEALPVYANVASSSPQHAGARFAHGRLLLARGEDAGLAELDAAMDLDDEAIEPGCRMAYRFLVDRERQPEAGTYRERFDARQQLLEEAKQERATLGSVAALVDHELSEDELAPLREQLAGYPVIRDAYLRRKPMQHFPEQPVFFIVIVVKMSHFSKDPLKSDADKLQTHLAENLRLPWEFFVHAVRFKKKERSMLRERFGESVYRKT